PNGSVYDRQDVTLAVLQTTAGEIGVMYGHIPTVAGLEIGYAEINFDGGSEYIAVSEGFVVVRLETLSISVQSAESAKKIDVAREELAESRGETQLNSEDDTLDVNRAERALDRTNNRLHVAECQ